MCHIFMLVDYLVATKVVKWLQNLIVSLSTSFCLYLYLTNPCLIIQIDGAVQKHLRATQIDLMDFMQLAICSLSTPELRLNVLWFIWFVQEFFGLC